MERGEEPGLTLEQELKKRSFSADELGVQIIEREGGKSVKWIEKLNPRRPVTVPMLPPESQHSRQPHVEAVVNGKEKVRLSLDTGAAFTSFRLDTALAAELKIADPEQFKNTFKGLAGEEESYYGVADTLEIGELRFENIFSVIRTETNASPEAIGDVMGMASLAKVAWVVLDFPKREVTFGPDGPAPATRAEAVIPFEITGMQLTAEMVVNNQFQFPVLIDTGNDAPIMLPWGLIEEIGLSEEARQGKPGKYAGVGGAVETKTFRLKEITLGNGTFQNIEAVAVRGDFPPSVGSDFLDEYRVTIDVMKNRINLEKQAR